MMKSTLLLLISLSSLADVWMTTRQWNTIEEESYSNWVRSKSVHTKIFTSKSSTYYGIKADCADASYGLRAIYSFENGLPFAIKNPSGSRNAYKTIGNNLNKFDNISDRYERLKAFINYIGDSVGTENLSYNDTYPVKIKSITPGTLFTYKISTDNGFVRHSYNIKDILDTGNFRVIYSSQAIKKEGLPLRDTSSKTFSNLPHSFWGFRKFIQPGYHDTAPSLFPKEWNYSREQYALVKKLGEDFFDHVQKKLASRIETNEEKLSRLFAGVCNEAKSRISYVNQALKFRESINGRCMNYSEYDIYSTPARDKSLKNAFKILKKKLVKLENLGGLKLYELAMTIYKEEISISDEEDLTQLCPIKIDANTSLNLQQILSRISSGRISSHPNDGLAQRWGEDNSSRTTCKRWY